MGKRPFPDDSVYVRTRILAVLTAVCFPMPIVNVVQLAVSSDSVLNFSLFTIPVLIAVLAAIRFRFSVKISAIALGLAMEGVFIQGAYGLGSYASFLGLIFMPFFITFAAGPRISALLLLPQIAFIVIASNAFGALGLSPHRALVFFKDLSWPEFVNLMIFNLLLFVSSVALEKLILTVFQAYRKERAALEKSVEQIRLREQRLAEFSGILESIVSAFPLPTFVKNEKLELRLCSASFFQFFEVELKDVLGHNWVDKLGDEWKKLSMESDKRIASGDGAQYYSLKWRKPNGLVHELFVQKTALRQADGPFLGVVGVIVDESERAAREKRLKLLLETNREALSLLGHDLKNPIGSFRNLVHLFRENGDRDPQETEEILRELEGSLDSLWNLLNELLEWAREDGGFAVFNRRRYKILDQLRRAVASAQIQAREKNIALSVLTDAHVMVDADERMIDVILRNLISNAIKFTPMGGQVWVRAERVKGVKELRLTVSDTGVGLPPDVENGQVTCLRQRQGTGAEKGTGLGLPLVCRLVERHGGNVAAANRPEGGAIFTVRIPDEKR